MEERLQLMTSYNVRIVAYDVLSEVSWSVHMWDFDKPEDGQAESVWVASGTIPGRGLDQPSKWLREVLEALREAM
jgi:hypothetical protein